MLDSAAGRFEDAQAGFAQAEGVGAIAPAALAGRGLAAHSLGRRREAFELSDCGMAMLRERGPSCAADTRAYLCRLRLLIADDARLHSEEIEEHIDALAPCPRLQPRP